MKNKLTYLISLVAVLLLLAAILPATLAEDPGDLEPVSKLTWDEFYHRLQKDQYTVQVVDYEGKPVEGAAVTFTLYDTYWEKDYVQPVTTDSEGKATAQLEHSYPVTTVRQVEVSKEGYKTWNETVELNDSRFTVITLMYVNAEELALKSAICQRDIDDMGVAMTDVTRDVMQFNCKAPEKAVIDLSPRGFRLNCEANKPEIVTKYTIYQGGKQIATSTHGGFELNAESFVPKEKVYVKTEDSNGRYAVTELKLKFYTVSLVKEYMNINLSSFTLTVPEEVPYLGGSKVNIDLPVRAPISVVVTKDGKIQIGYGVTRDDTDEARVKKIQDAKALMSEVASTTATAINNSGLTEAQSAKLKELTTASNGTKFMKPCDVRVIGYAELDFGGDNWDNLDSISGNILLQIDLPLVDGSWTTWVGIVPVTASLKISAGLNATIDFTYDFNDETFSAGTLLKPYASLNAFGGIGIGKVAAVGAYGNATLELTIDSKPGWHVQSLNLTGELGLKAYVWIFSYQKTFAKDTWKIYENEDYKPRGINGPDDAGAYFNSLLGMNDFSQYREESLAYLKNEGAWISERDDLVPRGEDAAASFTTMVSGTYRNAQPVMVSANGNLYAAFIRANDDGRVYTVVAKYENGQWSDRMETQTDAVMDSNPQLVVSGDTIYLSYLRMPSEMNRQSLVARDGESQLLAYAQNQQLIVGQLDPDTLRFTEDKVFQCDGYLHSYTIRATDDSVTVAWFESEVSDANSVLLQSQSVLRTATRTANGWSEARDVANISGDVGDIILGERDGETLIAYTVNHPVAETGDVKAAEDGENAENTENTATTSRLDNTTASLYVIGSDGSATCITEECDGKVSFAKLPGTEQSDFVWNDDGKLVNTAGESITVDRVNGTYVIVDNAVYYSATADSSSNLTVMYFVDGKWTSAIEMITDEAYLEDLSVVTVNGETYVLGMNTMVDILENDKLDDSKDMVFVQLTSVSDLVLADILYDRNSLVAGEDVTLDLYVINRGDHEVTSVEIWKNGDLFDTREITIPVNTTNVIPVTIQCPDQETTYSFEVRESGANQHCAEKNLRSVTLGYADPAVDIDLQDFGARKQVTILWTNEGISESECTLQLFASDGVEDKLLYEDELVLYPGEIYIHKEFADDIERNSSTVTLTAVITPKGNDSDPFNNRDKLIITFDDTKYTSYENMLILPAATRTIEDEAFVGCAFEAVEVNPELESIGSLAFANSSALKQVRLGYSISSIANDAFTGCTEVILWCPYGSYAAEYAHAQGISYALYAPQG